MRSAFANAGFLSTSAELLPRHEVVSFRTACGDDGTFRLDLGKSACVSPVIKHSRNVPDLVGARRAGGAQSEIVVPASSIAWRQAADFFDERTSIDGETRNHIVAKKQLRVPIGLEMGRMPCPVAVDLVFVRIDEIRARIIVQFDGDLVKRLLRKNVALTHTRNELAGGERQRDIVDLRIIRLDARPLDARIARRHLFQHRGDARRRRRRNA